VAKGSNQRAGTPEALAARQPTADLLEALRDFRVEWDDGSVGIAGAMGIFVRTGGWGTGHEKLELLTVDDVVAILPQERRIVARTRVPPRPVIGDMLRRGLWRARRRHGR
jgi:hypothetical protein